MMARITFDTLAYANRLKAVGVEPKIAEAQATVNAEMVANFLDDNWVTKPDLMQVESRLNHSIDELRLLTKQDLTQVESKLNHSIEKLRLEIYEKLQVMENRLTLRLGGIMLGSMTAMGVVVSFLQISH